MVVPEHIRIQVRLKMLGSDVTVRPGNPVLDDAPETVYGLGMGRAVHVLLGRMVDGLMVESQVGESAIAGHLVGVDGCPFSSGNVLLDDGQECLGLHVISYQHHSVALTFHQSHSDGLASGPTTPLPRALPTNVGFVNLDLPEEGRVVTSHHLADLGEHPPGRLVGNPQLPLQVLGRDAHSSVGHQEHSIEPEAQRCRRLVVDSASGGVNMVATVVTAIGFAACYFVVLGDLLAGLAENPIRIQILLQPFKASIIGGELGIKLLFREPFHRLLSLQRRDSIA